MKLGSRLNTPSKLNVPVEQQSSVMIIIIIMTHGSAARYLHPEARSYLPNLQRPFCCPIMMAMVMMGMVMMPVRRSKVRQNDASLGMLPLHRSALSRVGLVECSERKTRQMITVANPTTS